LIPLSRIASAVNGILPANFFDEIGKNIQIVIASTTQENRSNGTVGHETILTKIDCEQAPTVFVISRR
jgi:hypothetical protein